MPEPLSRLWPIVYFNFGSAHGVAGSAGVLVGDRYAPAAIEATFPGVDGEPSADFKIEIRGGVPRFVELRLSATEGGREVRPKDLEAVDIDSWVEVVTSACSWVVTSREGSAYALGPSDDSSVVIAGAHAIQRARNISRRLMTEDRLQTVADAYNSSETHGLQAVEKAFNCSRSTASRYISAARSAKLIDDRRRNKSSEQK